MVRIISGAHGEPPIDISDELFERQRSTTVSEFDVSLPEELQEKIRQLLIAAYIEGWHRGSGQDRLDEIVRRLNEPD